MSLYSRLDRLAADVEKLNRQVTAVANSPQSQRTSVEGGSIDFNDADGNLMAIVGGQDDGSNTIRHVDGPTPPVPSGLSAHVDGPIVQVSWDGTFESDVTHDWHYLEVLAVGPNNEQLTGTINDLSGGETSLAATAQGDWFITARSVSRAGKRSLDGDAGTASVQLVGLTGAIEAIQESANGKSTIYYSSTEPVAPEGGFNNGDLWFDTSEEGNNTASVWDGNGWVSMEDARLATIIAAQEALESDLQDVQTSVDGKNKITWDPAAPPSVYSGPAGDTWYRTSGNDIIGFWKWTGSAWVAQMLAATTIPLIDIGTGTFGTMSGSRLAAKTVTADQLLIGSEANLIPWSPVATTAPHEPRYGTVLSGVVDATLGPVMHVTGGTQADGSMLACLVLAPGASTAGVPNSSLYVPLDTGRTYSMSALMMIQGTPPVSSGSVRYEIQYRDGNGAHIGRAYGSTTSLVGASSPVRVEMTVNPPAGTAFAQVHVHKNFWSSGVLVVQAPSLRVKSGATLIENGAITTDKLAVGSITAESGVIASLDLGKATVGELDGIRIMGQTIRGAQLSGDAIDGKVITGATIRSAATGARTLMSASGFEAYNNAGKRTFFASASTGNVSMTGELYTGESGAERVVLDNSLWNSVQITDPETGTLTNVPGAGVRIGVSSSSGADIYHGATTASGGRYVDQAVFRGPSGRARTVYGSASAGGGFPASSHVLSIADDNSGVVAAECRVTSSGIGSATRKVELIGADANGRSRALIRASGGNGKSNMWGLDANGIETSEVASDGPNRSAWLGGKDSSGALTAYVASFGNSGTTDISGSNQNPLNVNYTGTSDWWVVPFKKGGTSWGYIGSSGAMGVDEFGVQSASGKDLVLRTTDSGNVVTVYSQGQRVFTTQADGSNALVVMPTIGSSTGSGSNYVVSSGGGGLRRIGSSARYKNNIQPVTEDYADKLLSLEYKSWVDKGEDERYQRYLEWRESTPIGPAPQEFFESLDEPHRYGGLIAEEVAEAGLPLLVEYDEFDRPNSVNYDRIGPALIPIARDHRDQIAELRARIEELERQTHE